VKIINKKDTRKENIFLLNGFSVRDTKKIAAEFKAEKQTTLDDLKNKFK
jgi:hypothetical protein